MKKDERNQRKRCKWTKVGACIQRHALNVREVCQCSDLYLRCSCYLFERRDEARRPLEVCKVVKNKHTIADIIISDSTSINSQQCLEGADGIYMHMLA